MTITFPSNGNSAALASQLLGFPIPDILAQKTTANNN
jgi:hypothetical protein